MHTDTIAPRTDFLATPQFGFAHLRGSLTCVEPIHDFLVVQFGAMAGFVASARRGQPVAHATPCPEALP